MRRRRRRALCGHRQPLEVCEGVEGRGEGRDNNIYEYTYMGEAGGTGGVTRCISLYLSFSLFFPSSLFFISLLLHLPFPSSLFFISLLLHHPFPSSLFFSRRVLASSLLFPPHVPPMSGKEVRDGLFSKTRPSRMPVKSVRNMRKRERPIPMIQPADLILVRGVGSVVCVCVCVCVCGQWLRGWIDGGRD